MYLSPHTQACRQDSPSGICLERWHHPEREPAQPLTAHTAKQQAVRVPDETLGAEHNYTASLPSRNIQFGPRVRHACVSVSKV